MGIKLIKEQFRIHHIAHIDAGLFHIGSPFISTILSFNIDGELVYGAENLANKDLVRYNNEISENKALFKQLWEQADPQKGDIGVFWVSDDCSISEDTCDEFGWPNTTHSGALMYENTHFKTKREAAERGIRDVEAGIRSFKSNINEARQTIARCESAIAEGEKNLNLLLKLL
jgi:hypothetical protein